MLKAKPARGSPVSPWELSEPKSKSTFGAYQTSDRGSARLIAAIARSENGSSVCVSKRGQPAGVAHSSQPVPGHGSFRMLYPSSRDASRNRRATWRQARANRFWIPTPATGSLAQKLSKAR